MGVEEYMCGDIWTWLQDVSGRVFRYWVYKRMFTPLEMEQKYVDQYVFEDSHANTGIIRECIQLPDGDFLLGFQSFDGCTSAFDLPGGLEYYKLSEIRLAYYPADAEMPESDE